ncbi:unnamed protein product [Phytomonas sp. EM1]|nr:unnamed protein product [Phytomonas sp. EM1]|eukprot:CCW61049.1 unnamed protein product [Phytomonas sp. isolate EM1]
MPGEDTARRIKEGQQRRLDRQRQLRRLKNEYGAELRWKEERTHTGGGLATYLPNILIFLVAVSLPLSETDVDWVLVGLLCLFNALWGFLARRPSHWAYSCLLLSCNLCLVHLAPPMHQSLSLLPTAPSRPLGFFMGFHALYAVFMYYGYVERRFWFKMDYDASLAAFSEDGGGNAARGDREVTALLRLAMNRKKWDRLDRGLVALVLADVGILLWAGVISPEEILRTLRGALGIFG